MLNTTKNNKITNRFIISKTLIGKNAIISFKNNKGIDITYDHDKVYTTLQTKFDSMPCFAKYNSYTNSNNLPLFVRTIEYI